MTSYAIPLDDPLATLEIVGGKGASLAKLANSGLTVPDGFHATTAAYREFVTTAGLQAKILTALDVVDVSRPATLEAASRTIRELFSQAEMPPTIAGAIGQAYAGLVGQNPTVAVRSSATAEDLPGLSFAGQQDTYLNIAGITDVLDAVVRCWASLWTARAIGYRTQHSIDHESVSMAVVVQLLIPAEAAGIMFTANPVTGARNEATINAAWGLGEAIVGGLVTPDTLTVDKDAGTVLAREIATKDVMTVRVNGGTEEQSVPQKLKDVPVLSDQQTAELGRLGVQIEELYGMPTDIEWTLLDGEFAIVQARPITALPDAEVAPPTEWPLPNPKSKYVRASIIDLMPNPISPLFATLAFKAYDAGIVRAMSDVTRSKAVILPEHFVTINGYVYSDARFSGRELWWLLTRMLPAFPRMMRTGVSYWRENGRAPYVKTVRRWEGQPLTDLPAADLLDGACEIVRAAMVNLTAQMVWMGACAGSEMLFTRVYDRLVKRAGEPDVTAFLMAMTAPPSARKSRSTSLPRGAADAIRLLRTSRTHHQGSSSRNWRAFRFQPAWRRTTGSRSGNIFALTFSNSDTSSTISTLPSRCH